MIVAFFIKFDVLSGLRYFNSYFLERKYAKNFSYMVLYKSFAGVWGCFFQKHPRSCILERKYVKNFSYKVLYKSFARGYGGAFFKSIPGHSNPEASKLASERFIFQTYDVPNRHHP